MAAQDRNPMRIPPAKRRRRNPSSKAACKPAGGFVVSGEPGSAGGLLDRVTFDVFLPARDDIERYVGETRRCAGAFRLREIEPGIFEVYALYLRVLGGGPDLLSGRFERGQSIPGRFSSVAAADAAAVAWATAFNETVAG